MKKIDQWINARIGLGQTAESTLANIRFEQVYSIVKLTPAMMTGNVVIATVLLNSFRGAPGFLGVTGWAITVFLVAAFGLKGWVGSQKRASRRRASRRAINHAVANAFVLGILWGALPLLSYASAPPELRMMIGVIAAGMICGGSFALSALPQAVFAFLVPMVFGSTIAFFSTSSYLESMVAVLFVTYCGIIVFSTLSLAKTFVGRLIAEATANDRGEVISMLLKNFEENSSDWLWSTSGDGKLERVSKRFSEAARRGVDELTGVSVVEMLNSPVTRKHPGYGAILESIRHRTAFSEIELPIMVENETRWWRLTGQPFHDESGEFTGFRGVGSDVTGQKEAESRISYLAHNDALTGLPNRARFGESLNQSLARMARFGTGFSLLYLDLDHFKAVNDTKGHDVGDKLLIEVSRRFSAILRETDILARLGGDEFAILQQNGGDSREAAKLAERLIKCVAEPIVIDKDKMVIGVSVGLAMAPGDGNEAEQLLRNADLALYRAKNDGRRLYRFFEEEMDKRAQERRALEFDLGMALQKGELELYYQPLVNVSDGSATGFEALIRWNHPERGFIPPATFIPIAEQTGIIKTIGAWVLNEACRSASEWPDHLTVAVNLSPRQFDSAKIVDTISEALAKSRLKASRLEVEITESLLMDNSEGVSEILHQIKELGVSIAMDDFGTGYSSLAYLWKFPFDKIKIDRSFVAAIENDQAARDILKTIGSLGETLNMRITAEGVETPEQAAFLKTIAHQLQGFYFARPLGSIDLAAFLITDFARAKALMKPEAAVKNAA